MPKPMSFCNSKTQVSCLARAHQSQTEWLDPSFSSVSSLIAQGSSPGDSLQSCTSLLRHLHTRWASATGLSLVYSSATTPLNYLVARSEDLLVQSCQAHVLTSTGCKRCSWPRWHSVQTPHNPIVPGTITCSSDVLRDTRDVCTSFGFAVASAGSLLNHPFDFDCFQLLYEGKKVCVQKPSTFGLSTLTQKCVQ